MTKSDLEQDSKGVFFLSHSDCFTQINPEDALVLSRQGTIKPRELLFHRMRGKQRKTSWLLPRPASVHESPRDMSLC